MDVERGYGGLLIDLDDDALEHLIHVAGGDARNALNALELAVESTLPDADQHIHITSEVAQESIQRRAILYDKDGDAHYDTISAFIKSVRGSDPDAALYWLAKMLYAGEDPRFILRRLLILAGEDIGLGDPLGLVVANAAAQAFMFMGLPEGVYPIVEATIYLATAPKSNSAGTYFRALKQVEAEGKVDVPIHLQDANRDAKALGHGQGYQYPHEFDGPSHPAELSAGSDQGHALLRAERSGLRDAGGRSVGALAQGRGAGAVDRAARRAAGHGAGDHRAEEEAEMNNDNDQ